MPHIDVDATRLFPLQFRRSQQGKYSSKDAKGMITVRGSYVATSCLSRPQVAVIPMYALSCHGFALWVVYVLMCGGAVLFR
jgi:hypothetical protein